MRGADERRGRGGPEIDQNTARVPVSTGREEMLTCKDGHSKWIRLSGSQIHAHQMR